jgi:hypothetical protein
MTPERLAALQDEMKTRLKNPVRRGPKTHESKKEIKRALKAARALRKKKHADHKRYLALKKEKRKLTRALRDELKQALIEWRELGLAMKSAESELKGLMADSDRRSRQFQLGLKVGREETKAQQLQKELDQQAQNRKGNYDQRTERPNL